MAPRYSNIDARYMLNSCRTRLSMIIDLSKSQKDEPPIYEMTDQELDLLKLVHEILIRHEVKMENG